MPLQEKRGNNNVEEGIIATFSEYINAHRSTLLRESLN